MDIDIQVRGRVFSRRPRPFAAAAAQGSCQMRISQSAEYALRAVIWLAANPEARSTAAVARGTRVPAGYLSKILQLLARRGIVASWPGRLRGFALTRTPGAMTVLDVVNAVDPVRRIHTCPLGIAAHGTNLCPLHRSLDQVAESAERAFDQTTIAQLLGGEAVPGSLCNVSARAVNPIREPLPTRRASALRTRAARSKPR
jgi:Rrf2 family protein